MDSSVTSWQRAQRGAVVVLIALVLVSFGLFMTGRSGQAFGFFKRLSGPGFILEPIDGSKAAPIQLMRTTNGPEYARFCTLGRSTFHIITHYEQIAKKRALVLAEGLAPYAKVERSDFALITWQDRAGWRCGVVAFPLGGDERTRYILFQGGAAPRPIDPGVNGAIMLPLGIEAPRGSRALFDVRLEAKAMAYYQIPGDPSQVLGVMENRLERAGCQVDEKARAALGDHFAASGSVVIPFQKGQQRGLLTLQRGSEPNSTELSLVLRDQ